METIYEQIQSWQGKDFKQVAYQAEVKTSDTLFIRGKSTVIGMVCSTSSPNVNVQVRIDGHVRLSESDASTLGVPIDYPCISFKNYTLVKDGKVNVTDVQIDGRVEVVLPATDPKDRNRAQLDNSLRIINSLKAQLKGAESNKQKKVDTTPELLKKYNIKNGVYTEPYKKVETDKPVQMKKTYPKISIKGETVPSFNAVKKKADANKKLKPIELKMMESVGASEEVQKDLKKTLQEQTIEFSRMYINLYNKGLLS